MIMEFSQVAMYLCTLNSKQPKAVQTEVLNDWWYLQVHTRDPSYTANVYRAVVGKPCNIYRLRRNPMIIMGFPYNL